MTDDDRRARNSTAWQRHRAARSLAHHAADAADLAGLLDMLGLSAIEGRLPPADEPAPRPHRQPTPLAKDTADRLTSLLREAMPSATAHTPSGEQSSR